MTGIWLVSVERWTSLIAVRLSRKINTLFDQLQVFCLILSLSINFISVLLQFCKLLSLFLDLVIKSLIWLMLERVVKFCKAFGKMVFRIKFIAAFHLKSCLMVHPTVFWVLPKGSIRNFFGYLAMIVLNLVVLLFEMIGRSITALFELVNPKLIRFSQMPLHLFHLNVGSVIGVLFESRLMLPPFLGIPLCNLVLRDVASEAKEVSPVLLVKAAKHFIFALYLDSCDGLPWASITNEAKAGIFPIFNTARSKPVHPHELFEVQCLRVFLIFTRLM